MSRSTNMRCIGACHCLYCMRHGMVTQIPAKTRRASLLLLRHRTAATASYWPQGCGLESGGVPMSSITVAVGCNPRVQLQIMSEILPVSTQERNWKIVYSCLKKGESDSRTASGTRTAIQNAKAKHGKEHEHRQTQPLSLLASY